jgi:hypothetical protein
MKKEGAIRHTTVMGYTTPENVESDLEDVRDGCSAFSIPNSEGRTNGFNG